MKLGVKRLEVHDNNRKRIPKRSETKKCCAGGVKACTRISIVACITVGGSRNGPSPTTNSTPKSEASTANSISARINRFFDFWTSLAPYIYR